MCSYGKQYKIPVTGASEWMHIFSVMRQCCPCDDLAICSCVPDPKVDVDIVQPAGERRYQNIAAPCWLMASPDADFSRLLAHYVAPRV